MSRKFKLVMLAGVMTVLSSCSIFHPCHCPHFGKVQGKMVRPMMA